jgi:hypothetical protein
VCSWVHINISLIKNKCWLWFKLAVMNWLKIPVPRLHAWKVYMSVIFWSLGFSNCIAVFISVKHKFKLEHQVFCINLAWNVSQLGNIKGKIIRKFLKVWVNLLKHCSVYLRLYLQQLMAHQSSCLLWCHFFHAQVTCDSPRCLLLSSLAVHSLPLLNSDCPVGFCSYFVMCATLVTQCYRFAPNLKGV